MNIIYIDKDKYQYHCCYTCKYNVEHHDTIFDEAVGARTKYISQRCDIDGHYISDPMHRVCDCCWVAWDNK